MRNNEIATYSEIISKVAPDRMSSNVRYIAALLYAQSSLLGKPASSAKVQDVVMTPGKLRRDSEVSALRPDLIDKIFRTLPDFVSEKKNENKLSEWSITPQGVSWLESVSGLSISSL